MLRATIWTVGLFGAGTAISQIFPGTWTEPLVLFGLGVALLLASARTARGTAPAPAESAGATAPRATPRPATPSAPIPAAVPATVTAASPLQVERTA